jgi:uncharacterized protein
MGIRRSGASKASTASFLVATPETGVDSIGITYALMGPIMAIARPISAVFSAIVTGLMIQWFGRPDTKIEHKSEHKSGSTCCGSKTIVELNWIEKCQAILQFGFGQLLRDFMLWLLIGLFFAAAVTTFVPEGMLAQYGQGILAMTLVVLISIPMYVCATASTPIAVGLLLSGITPGAALVFMLTGPATNIATLMVIKRELGGKELALYLFSIILSALASGLLLDFLFDHFAWTLQLVQGHHSELVSNLYQISAVILAGLIFFQLYKKWMPKTKDCCEH